MTAAGGRSLNGTRPPPPGGATLAALPDALEMPVELTRGGLPTFRWLNRFVPPDEAVDWLLSRSRTVWWPTLPGAPPVAQPDWAVNLLADADYYAAGLAAHDDWLHDDVPVFNHPRAVAQCRRDLSAARLSGVAGLVVPRCLRFRLDGPGSLAEAFERGGFRFPVLLRPCGGQGGMGQVRVEGPEGWQAAAETRWAGTPHFMTQFADFGTATGVHLKARVVFAAGRPYLRHVKAAIGWQVHNRSDDKIADIDELAIIDRLEADAVFTGLCAEVGRRLRLEFCGMDVGVDPDRGRYVLFECNPAMSVFFPERPGQSAAQVARRDRLQVPARAAVIDLIRDPARWTSTRTLDATFPPVGTALAAPM